MRMPRILSGLFIFCYLSWLAWGIGAHVLKIGLDGNTLGYYVVWDMFCGWQAYDNRTHLLAEGVSGQFYEVRAPWGEFNPFGNVARVHYDVTNNLVPKHIRNVLRNTSHEPIDRVYVVQEIWPKQFNIPDTLWARYFEEPQDRNSYFNLRAICSDRGSLLNSYPDWYAAQTLKAVADNPRLQMSARQATPFYDTFIRPNRGEESRASEFQSVSDGGLSTN